MLVAVMRTTIYPAVNQLTRTCRRLEFSAAKAIDSRTPVFGVDPQCSSQCVTPMRGRLTSSPDSIWRYTFTTPCTSLFSDQSQK